MINFSCHYQLRKRNRKTLTPLQESDYQHLEYFAIQEPELWKYSLQKGCSPEKLKTHLQIVLEGRKQENTSAFFVFDKRSQQYTDCTRFHDIQPQNTSLQLGYTWFGKQFQGTGLNKNYKYLLLKFDFETLQMQRIEFRADNENQKSINAIKSIYCVVEGVLRNHLLQSRWQPTR